MTSEQLDTARHVLVLVIMTFFGLAFFGGGCFQLIQACRIGRVYAPTERDVAMNEHPIAFWIGVIWWTISILMGILLLAFVLHEGFGVWWPFGE